MHILDLRNDGTNQSNGWCDYFRANRTTSADLPWDDAYKLTQGERLAIERSIQQFQLGEGAAGRRLLERGHAYSEAAGDPFFQEALTLFIKEEQRHSGHLLRFMRQQGIPAIGKHWLDSVFRRLRVFSGLELELRVLVTAEIIAVPYYRAPRRSYAVAAPAVYQRENPAGRSRPPEISILHAVEARGKSILMVEDIGIFRPWVLPRRHLLSRVDRAPQRFRGRRIFLSPISERGAVRVVWLGGKCRSETGAI